MSLDTLFREHSLSLGRLDHAAAAEFFLRDLETRGPIVNAPMHVEWHDAADRYKLLCIEAPRDHAKTEQMVVARTISELGRNSNLRIKIVCENDTWAQKRVSAISRHIQTNDWVHQLFPWLVPQDPRGWSKTAPVVARENISKDASVEGYGVSTNSGGGRADLLIFDDVCGFRNTIAHPAEREIVKELIPNVWMNMLEPDGRAIYVFTPWHKDDASAMIKSNPNWKVISYPVRDFVGPWPMKWSSERLRARLGEIGLRAYQRGYELKALTDEEALFPLDIIEGARDWDVALGARYPEDWPRISGVDLASSLRAGGAFTVGFTIVLTPDGHRIPIEILRHKQIFDDTVKMVEGMWLRHHPSVIVVENNGFQESLVTHLGVKHPDIPIHGHTTGSNKKHLELGLPGFQTQLRNKAWVIPKGGCTGGSDCNCPIDKWEQEMAEYPVGTTSDVVMAWWLSECGVRLIQGVAESVANLRPAVETVILNPMQAGPMDEWETPPDLPPSWLGGDDL